MSSTQSMCTSFKKELLSGTHVFGTDTIKLALYTDTATNSAATTVYGTADEVSSANYTAGGSVVAVQAPSSGGTTGYCGPVNGTSLTWSNVTIPNLQSAMLYNASKGNKSISIHTFTKQNISAGTVIITFPDTNASTGLIRIE